MSPVLLVFLLLTIGFGSYSIYLSNRDRKNRELLSREQQNLARKVYELSQLDSLSGQIGYSVNMKTIVETIAASVKELFEITTVSYALIEDKNILIKSFLKEGAQAKYLEEVENIMLQALASIEEEITTYAKVHISPQLLIEKYTILPFDTLPQSYFNIPLVVNNKLVGMLTISSRQPQVYQEEDMSILYKIVNRASVAYSKLKEVILTEQGKLESLVASLPTGIIMFSFENAVFNVSYFNQAADSILLLRENPTVQDVFVSFSPINIGEHVKGVLLEKKVVIVEGVKLHNKYLNVIINPVFLHQTNTLIGISIVMEDLTAEKEAQMARQNFTDMVVHELRAPLTSIKGASSLLLTQTLSQEDRQKMFQLVYESATRMMDDVGDLLDAAKIEEGRFRIHKERQDINDVIKQKIDAFLSVAQLKGVSIHHELDSHLTPFLFDAARMGQVMNNLLSNSIKYTPAGGVVTVRTSQEAGFVKIAVSDTGIGMPEDKKGLLFSKYGQLHSNIFHEGTGLGLYISRGIVESHGGKIWINSEQGTGTNVLFMIPYIQREEENLEHPQRIVN